MSRALTPVQRATAILANQFGAIAHRQAIESGLSEQRIRTLAEKRVWRRPLRGVYVAAGAPDTAQQRAMVAWLATRRGDGVLSFVSAAWAHDLVPASPLPHVTVRPGASPRCPGARVHRSRVPPEDRVRQWGMSVTSPSRTIVDLASVFERSRLDEVVDAAFCRKLATAASVEACIGRLGRGHEGMDAARRSIAMWTPGIEPDSVAEMRLLRHLADLGLVGLVTQHEVWGPGGFVARLDLAAVDLRRGFEYDGVLHHSPRYWGRDEPRYATLKAMGWSIETVTKADLLPGETRLRRIVERWLASATG